MVLTVAALLALVGGIGLPAQTASGQVPSRAQQNGRDSEMTDSARQRLEERQRRAQVMDIQAQKNTLAELRISFAERGMPTEDDLRAFEEALQEVILAAGLDPNTEMAEIGGFMFIEPVMLGPGRGVRGDGAIIEQPGGIGQLAQVEAGEEIELNFAEPVDLSEFAKFVARALSVNIFADPALEAQVIQFMAPVKVPRDNLLDLLAALVEERGFVLLYDRLGFYKIEARGNIPPGFGPDAKRSTSRMISTPLVRASQLVPLIESLFGAAAQSNITLTPLDDLGVLVVSGPPRVLDSVEDAVARFVQRQLGQQYFSFALEHVSAEFARDRLLVITGEVAPDGSAARPGAAVPAAAARPGGGSAGNPGSLSNLSGRLIVGAGNTLIFRGEPAESELVRVLIGSIDTITRLLPRRYTAGSVAEQAAIAASGLGLGPVTYAEQAGGTGTFGGGLRTPTAGGTRTGLFGTGLGEPAATITGSKIVVDLQNGTIVYHGTESQHRIFEEIVDQFVKDAVQDETVIRTYKIDNTDATALAGLLQDLIDDPRQQLGASPLFPGQRTPGTQPGQPMAPRPDAEGVAEALAADPLSVGLIVDPDETRIIADADRNQIIIKAKPAAQRQFARLIEQLDQRQPQVQLNVQIVSVSTSNNFNWGADFQANIGDFFSFSTFGVTNAPDNPFDPPGFNVSGSGIVAGIIDSNAISLVIQALETIGDTRLVSNPSIIVNDNQPANLASRRIEPFATTSQGGDTTITGQGGSEEAGTILNVTPQISSGGYISLEYEITLSSFDVGGRQPGLSPPRQEETYSSFVTLPSDATIIVGGFRQTTDSDTESRVPILGSLPIVGNVFKQRSVQRQERTIFVFITPRILDNPRFADLRLITEGPRAEAEIKADIPPLDTVRIPIRTGAVQRALPENRLIRENLLIDLPMPPANPMQDDERE